ncbi:hypothetical protein [Rhizorhabdus argentea]|uniref:hypothetical protein n=1 Tax=Rhizorhabdus argentea TaxID=1387174 RepID=UPI0030EFA104
MRGGALPPALLLASLALALAFEAPRIRIWSLVALAGTLAALSWMPPPRDWLEIAFLGCWTSMAGTAAAVHLPRGLGLAGSVTLSINAGLWASAVVGLAGSPPDILKALAALLLMLPARWLIARRGAIAVKVASSWLIAIAVLAGALPFLSVTPGYLPDHLE